MAVGADCTTGPRQRRLRGLGGGAQRLAAALPGGLLFSLALLGRRVLEAAADSEGMTIILAEQNASFSLKLSDRAYILEKGAVCWSGESSRLREQPEILERFLGV